MYRKHIHRNKSNNLKIRNRIRTKDKDRVITFKETTIYKPLIYVFFAFLFIFITLFPNSIFDELFPDVMVFFREMVKFASLSALNTLFTLPVSLQDGFLIAAFANPIRYSNFYVVYLVLYSIVVDTGFAIIGYRFARNLSKIFVKKSKKLKDKAKMDSIIDKFGWVGMYLAAATPLPFTIAIYYAGAVKMNFKKFIIATIAGRASKYAMYAFLLRVFNINIIDLGNQILEMIKNWF
jgi:uncharacterized membrane protein YdjX (TVP38/TMEM64 family)